MSATVEYVLAKDGVKKRHIEETSVSNINDLISEAAAGVPTDLPSVMKGPEPHGTRVHMRATRNRIVLYCMLLRIRLDSIWRPYGAESKKVYPFGAKSADTDFGATFEWRPFGFDRYPKKAGDKPECKAGDMFVYFIFTTTKEGQAWKTGDNYLIATRMGDKKFYRLPLHNIFDDGRICMGDSYTVQGATLHERFNNALAHFEASPWNTHIAQAHENTQALFSFSLKGEQLPIPDDWHKQCTAVNNTIYADLPSLLIP